MPRAEVAIVPGSHGGFNRINELNDRIAAFIEAQAGSLRGRGDDADTPDLNGQTGADTAHR
jgi:hypothetical protein